MADFMDDFMETDDTGGDGDTIGIEKEKKTEVLVDSVSGRGQDNEGFEEEEEEEEVDVGMSEEKKEEAPLLGDGNSQSPTSKKSEVSAAPAAPAVQASAAAPATPAAAAPASPAAAAPASPPAAAPASPPAAAPASPPAAAQAAQPADAAPEMDPIQNDPEVNVQPEGENENGQNGNDDNRIGMDDGNQPVAPPRKENRGRGRNPRPPPLLPIDRMNYSGKWWNIFMLIITILIAVAAILFFMTDLFYHSEPPSVCSSSRIPIVSSDGQMDKNVWNEQDLLFIPCWKAWAYNNAIRKQMAEGVDEKGNPRSLLEKMEIYHRAVARVTDKSVVSLKGLITDEIRNTKCELLLKSNQDPTAYLSTLCFDPRDGTHHFPPLIECSHRGCFTLEDKTRSKIPEDLPAKNEPEEALDALRKFETISFFYSFVFGEYREIALHDLTNHRIDTWSNLQKAVDKHDYKLFTDEVKKFGKKEMHQFMSDFVQRMINRLQKAANNNPSDGETLSDWIRSMKTGEYQFPTGYRVTIETLTHPHCTGLCHAISPSSRRNINDATLFPIKWTIYILFIFSIPQLILYFFSIFQIRPQRRNQGNAGEEDGGIEMNDVVDNSNDDTNDDAQLLVGGTRRRNRTFEKIVQVISDYHFCGPFIVVATLLSAITIVWMVSDLAYLRIVPTLSTVCDANLIPAVSSDGQIKMNIWEDESLVMIPCKNAEEFNFAFVEQIHEGMKKNLNIQNGRKFRMDEEGALGAFLNGVDRYQRAIAGIKEKSFESVLHFLHDDFAKANCVELFEPSILGLETYVNLCAVYDFERTKAGIEEYSSGSRFHLSLEKISFFYTLMKSDFRKMTADEAENVNVDIWNLLRDSIEEGDPKKYVDIVRSLPHDNKSEREFFTIVISNVMRNLEYMRKRNPIHGEELYNRVVAPSCRGMCSILLFDSWSERVNDNVLFFYKIFLYILFYPLFFDMMNYICFRRGWTVEDLLWKIAIIPLGIVCIFATVNIVYLFAFSKSEKISTSLCDPSHIPSLSGIHSKKGIDKDDLFIMPCLNARNYNTDVMKLIMNQAKNGMDNGEKKTNNKESDDYLDALTNYHRALARVTNKKATFLTQYLKGDFALSKCTELHDFGLSYYRNLCRAAHSVKPRKDQFDELHWNWHGYIKYDNAGDNAFHNWLSTISLFHAFLNGEYRPAVAELIKQKNVNLWNEIAYSIDNEDIEEFWSTVNNKRNQGESGRLVTYVVDTMIEMIHTMSVKNPEMGETWSKYLDRTINDREIDHVCTGFCSFLRDHYGVDLGNSKLSLAVPIPFIVFYGILTCILRMLIP